LINIFCFFYEGSKTMKTVILLIMTIAFLPCLTFGQQFAQPPAQPSEEVPEVLTSGPVHEAFAEPVNLESQSPVVAPSEPPDDIDEDLPAERPIGDYVWVPGYWAWDSQRTSYIWVSGCWRIAPPSRYWVPGYWSQTPGGYQWVPGFWASTSNIGQIEYLPEPPALVDVEPTVVAVSADNIWVPPCYYWNQGQYVLRRGYWIQAQPNWIWVPSHYVWTPRGYVFASGHWDYEFANRGVLFAPIYFPRRVLARPHVSYSLSIVLDIGNLQFGLFTYPRYSHYYFGDYYDDVYLGIGIFPWFQSRTRYTWYDPIYENYRWRHLRSEPRWDQNIRDDYDHRRANIDLRPSRTYREMENRLAKMPIIQQKTYWTAVPLKTEIAEKKGQMKFENSNKNEQQRISRKTVEVRDFVKERSKWESQPSQRQETGRPAPSGGNRGTAAPSAGERQPPDSTQGGRQSRGNAPQATQPSAEGRGTPTPPTGRGQPSTQPSGERQSRGNAPQATQPSTQSRGTMTPQTGRDQPASQPSGERQSRGNSPQATQPKASETVKTTTPPIANKPNLIQKMFGIGTPSKPTAENKISSSNKSSQTNPSRGNSSQSESSKRKDTGSSSENTRQGENNQGGANRRGRQND
jgi:hypothetical protein